MSSISGGSYQYSSFGGSNSGDNVDNNKVDSLNTSAAEHPDIAKANNLRKTIESFKKDGKCDKEHLRNAMCMRINYRDQHHFEAMKKFDFNDAQFELLAHCIDSELDGKSSQIKRLACEIFDKIKLNPSHPEVHNVFSKTIYCFTPDCIINAMIMQIYIEAFGMNGRSEENSTFFDKLYANTNPYDLILDAIDEFIADKRKELANLPRTSDSSISSLSTAATSATSTTSAAAAAAAAAAIISSSSPAPFADATQPSSSSTSNDAAHKRIDKLQRKIVKKEKKLNEQIKKLEDLNAEKAKLESELKPKH